MTVIWYLAKFVVFTQQQNIKRVEENKNDVLAVTRFVKVQNFSTKIVSNRR